MAGLIEFLAGVHIPAETLWTGVVTLIGALLGSGVIVAYMNRRKTSAEALHEGADAAKVITDAAREAVELHAQVWEQRLIQAKTDCMELVKRAVAESEQRCEERALERKLERDQAFRIEKEARDEEIRQLREYAAFQVKEACERTTRLETKVTDLTELLNAREEELAEIVRGIERETSR